MRASKKFILHCESKTNSWNDTFGSKTAAIQAGRKALESHELAECYVYQATGFQNVGTYATFRVWTAPQAKLMRRNED
jgi:hypothetical protein